jgi:hypothetical protein
MQAVARDREEVCKQLHVIGRKYASICGCDRVAQSASASSVYLRFGHACTHTLLPALERYAMDDSQPLSRAVHSIRVRAGSRVRARAVQGKASPVATGQPSAASQSVHLLREVFYPRRRLHWHFSGFRWLTSLLGFCLHLISSVSTRTALGRLRI